MDTQTDSVRAPRQDRSRRTLARITEAARQLLVEGGPEAVTIQAVVGRAAASVGSFYARFSGKEDLLRYLDETAWAAARRRWEEALALQDWGRLSLPQTVERVVTLLLENERIEAPERRALAAREGGAQRERDFQAGVRDSVRRLLLPHWSAIRHPDAPLAVELGLRAVMGALEDLEETEASAQPTLWDLEAGRVVQELSRLYLGYLGSGESGASAGPVDFFDVWA